MRTMKQVSGLPLSWLAFCAACNALYPDWTVKHATNPNVAKQISSIYFAPAVDCSYASRAEPDQRLRLWLTETLLPQVYQRAGGESARVVDAPKSQTCKVLYDEFFAGRSDWRDPLQKKIAAALLEERPEDHVFVVMFEVEQECEEKRVGIRNRSGNDVGSIGTGKFACYELSTFQLVAHLMTREGERVYSAWLPVWVQNQEQKYTPAVAATVVEKLLVGYPGAGAVPR